MTLKIKTINIINLERRTDLEIAHRAVWTCLGAAPDQLVFHTAKDGLSYESRESLIDAARADGFKFFSRDVCNADDLWWGVGEAACLWSISCLLREIAQQAEGIYLYVLADRFSKRRIPYLQRLFKALPDFMFFQFKGHIPYWDHLEREVLQANYVHAYVPACDAVESETVEFKKLKHGDGVLAMTPLGARWMLSLAEHQYRFLTPYECMLWCEGCERKSCPDGVYSTTLAEYDYSDESSVWEGEFPHPLAGYAASDIGHSNKMTQTGAYQKDNAAYGTKHFGKVLS